MLPRLRRLNKHVRVHLRKTSRRLDSNVSGSSSGGGPDNAFVKGMGIGVGAGALGSLAGLGGGFIMIPLMTSRLLRLSQHQAHGSSLFAITTTGLAGALGYSGHVDLEAAAAIACTGIVTARFGVRAMSAMPEKMLKKSLGMLMIGVAPLVQAKTYFMEAGSKKTAGETADKENTAARLYVPALIGCFSGFASGLFGVGGGAIVVPALTVFTDMDHYAALGTSLCAMVLPAMSGTYANYQKGFVCMRTAPGLAVGAFIGAYLGGRLGSSIDETQLRWGFSSLMLVLGTRTLLK
ncbi:unnamed protein product [Cylindrotheca closterium]|uniref:Membrane transporter protein n=1 Tax=Cylindrotheca closterium TaxID=2856 RepID=A0AAD2CB17_9STRA|nr:unnamed protein product [Cylindrotheca closterium]